MIKITKLEQIQELNLQENNVFYLYGKTGSGKTYFSKELAKQIKKEVFYTDFTQIIRNISNDTYFDKIENKIVIIDDEIKQIIAKEVISLTVERILRKMQSKGNIIIIVSLLSPEELKNNPFSLAKFILSSEQIEICYDIESRIQIAEEYSKKCRTEIQEETLKSIAKKEKNLGKIKGVINQMSINYEEY